MRQSVLFGSIGRGSVALLARFLAKRSGTAVGAALGGHSQLPRNLASIMSIRKPELDHRIYEHRVVKVAGSEEGEEVDLRCLFVQDKETEKAAASMCVHVGAMYDPKQRPGLAHFCGMS